MKKVLLLIICIFSCSPKQKNNLQLDKNSNFENGKIDIQDLENIPFLESEGDQYIIYINRDFNYQSVDDYLEQVPSILYDNIIYFYYSNLNSNIKSFNNLLGIEKLQNIQAIDLISDTVFQNVKQLYFCEKLSSIKMKKFQSSLLNFNKFKSLEVLAVGVIPSLDYFYSYIPYQQLDDLYLSFDGGKITNTEYEIFENNLLNIRMVKEFFPKRITDVSNPERYIDTSMEDP